MKETVELNNNGRSIESHCKAFYKKKWENRYIVCKIQTDLEHPIFNIFKTKKDRQRDKIKQSIILKDYIGYERSFPLKSRNQTLAVITKDHNIILSFQLPETLLQWETWLRNFGGQCTTHYMQLLKFPNDHDNQSYIRKEVRCLLHDSRLVIVHGVPAETLLYCEVGAAAIVPDINNHLVSIRPHHSVNDEFVLSCPPIETFAKYLEKAKSSGESSLTQYLNKKDAEGAWLQNIRKPQKTQDSISHWSDTLSGFFNFMNPVSASTNPSEIFASRMAVNQAGLSVNSMKTPILSRKDRNNSIVEKPSNANYVNTYPYIKEDASSSKSRSCSLPEYVNIHHAVRTNNPELLQRKVSTLTSPNDDHRFSANSDKKFSRSSSKGRSMMDFSMLPYDGSERRHESWKKAKKFISAFSPKSQQDLNRNGRSSRRITKASSTSALQFNKERSRSCAPMEHSTSSINHYPEICDQIPSSSMSELDELPPNLNVAMGSSNAILAFRDYKGDETPPTGLVRVRDENPLKSRGGVNIALARRLASGIQGSYSKYDGERSTHIYQKENDSEIQKKFKKPISPVLEDTLDAIENAITIEQDKMKQSERRASSISFQKNHLVNIPCDVTTCSLESKNTKNHSGTISSAESSISTRSKNSSSNVRSDSPPVEIAPAILRRQTSQKTITMRKQSTSSVESLNSQQTARRVDEHPIILPSRVTVNNSSSAENSSADEAYPYYRNDYFQPKANNQQLAVSLSRLSLRRLSEGQGSIYSEATGMNGRQRYFRKNNKSRRSQKDNA